MNFNLLKTTNPIYFPKPDGVTPAPKLNTPDNAHDQLVDQVGLCVRTLQPTDDTADPPGPLTVTASPFVHIAGTESEQLIISGEGVTAIEVYDEDSTTWIPVTLAAQATIILPPAGQLRVTYSSTAPQIIRMPGSFNNSTGVTEVVTLAGSPATLQAVGRVMVFYISGGVVISIVLHGVSLTLVGWGTFIVPRGGELVVTYDELDPPYVVKAS